MWEVAAIACHPAHDDVFRHMEILPHSRAVHTPDENLSEPLVCQ